MLRLATRGRMLPVQPVIGWQLQVDAGHHGGPLQPSVHLQVSGGQEVTPVDHQMGGAALPAWGLLWRSCLLSSLCCEGLRSGS